MARSKLRRMGASRIDHINRRCSAPWAARIAPILAQWPLRLIVDRACLSRLAGGQGDALHQGDGDASGEQQAPACRNFDVLAAKLLQHDAAGEGRGCVADM
jgi:hypothetical protein